MRGSLGYFRLCVCAGFIVTSSLGCSGDTQNAAKTTDSTDQTDAHIGCVDATDCADGLLCDQSTGLCVLCVPNSTHCDGVSVVTCNSVGDGFLQPVNCDDGNACTTGDGCLDGACNIPTAKVCDDSDICTNDQCVATDGSCLHLPTGNPGCCGVNVDCDDGLACTTDTCDVATGSCSNTGGPCTELIKEWGQKGDKIGEIKDPRGIVVLSTGEVVIADASTNRLSVFSDQGEFIREFADASSGEGTLNHPSGLAALPDGRIVVGDPPNNRIVIFNADGTFDRALDGKPGDGTALDSPTAVATDPDGQSIWIADTNHNLIVKLSLDDKILASLGGKGDSPGKFRSPRGIWAHIPGKLLVADSKLNRVTLLDSTTGEPLGLFGETGSLAGQLYLPSEVIVTSAGYLGIADTGNGRVQFFQMCVPTCNDGAQCGDNGCGGKCGECAGADASCEQGMCTGAILGTDGCIAQTEEVATCNGCACEQCVCGLDDFCCTTAWDNLCVGICVNDCGATCPLGSPELAPSFTTQANIGGLSSPYALHVTPSGILWVTDNITAKIRAYKVLP